jgi:nitrate reductase gamma subunit
MDVVMYIFLVGSLALGTLAVIQFQILGEGYDYRGSISPWIRSILLFQPDATFMIGVPLAFQLHVLSSTALFLIWPYTRLVHVLSVPVGYLFRPYVVYRSRDAHRGARAVRRGWEASSRPRPRQRKQKQPVNRGL